ncbi:hypothetical protein [Weissella diestrammenae]|nr:hypothetical protein [Weissella diestrammenae]MCM0583273.1 hypothetical protein [Weissella diestrammenae]
MTDKNPSTDKKKQATNWPKYSILMSVYQNDQAEFLDRAIASMFAQTVPFDEFIIVVDGPILETVQAVLD